MPLTERDHALKERGFALLNASDVGDWLSAEPADLEKLHTSWDDLPNDEYLKDGGRYRRRRHSCFVVEGASATLATPAIQRAARRHAALV